MKPESNINEHLFRNLENFQSVDNEADWQKVRGRMGFEQKNGLARVWWAAAAIILLIGIGFLSQRYLMGSPEMVIARAGDLKKEVTLPDGSAVTLNKQAELLYPEKFNRRNREVMLRGEAFFEVESDPDWPFKVDVNKKAMVEVLGTSFNISSDAEANSITVQVVEGKVAFSPAEEGFPFIVLVKDQQATLSGGSIQREEVMDRNLMSWKTGILYFDQTRIGDMARLLSIHYGQKIRLDENIPSDITFTSTIDNQEFESVLEEISLVLGLNYTYEGALVTISKPD